MRASPWTRPSGLPSYPMGTPYHQFEGVIHGAYYAMFHAARGALLAVEGSGSTNHGQEVKSFARMV